MTPTEEMLRTLYFNRMNYGHDQKSVIWHCKTCQSPINAGGRAIHFTECPVKDKVKTIFDTQQMQSVYFTQPLEKVSSLQTEDAEKIQQIAENSMSCEYFLGTIDR